MTLVGAFALLALAIAAVGLHGLLASGVSPRQRCRRGRGVAAAAAGVVPAMRASSVAPAAILRGE